MTGTGHGKAAFGCLFFTPQFWLRWHGRSDKPAWSRRSRRWRRAGDGGKVHFRGFLQAWVCVLIRFGTGLAQLRPEPLPRLRLLVQLHRRDECGRLQAGIGRG
ncbi:MAG: hypothetical protein KGZ65_06430, partial [Sphingomonadales bacterium]|nr:hypothetical protein [Sphingomonadales bacterium]